jgi:hypothetical protein
VLFHDAGAGYASAMASKQDIVREPLEVLAAAKS